MKEHWKEFLILVLAILLMLSGCPVKCNREHDVIRDTVTTVTVEYIKQPPVYIKEYVPVAASSTAPAFIPGEYAPSQDVDSLLSQYNDLIEKFLTLRTYNDSVQLTDTCGINVGTVFLHDVISENKIMLRKPSYQLSFPFTTITSTITIKELCEPTRQVYIGGEVSGNISNPISGAAAGVLLKNKKDRIYGLKAGFVAVNASVYPQFSICTYWKIKLK